MRNGVFIWALGLGLNLIVLFLILVDRFPRFLLLKAADWSWAETKRYYVLGAVLFLPLSLAELLKLYYPSSEIISLIAQLWLLAVALLMGVYPQWMRPKG